MLIGLHSKLRLSPSRVCSRNNRQTRDALLLRSLGKDAQGRELIKQGPDFDDMSSFFPCEIDDAIQYINLGYGAQAPK